MSDPARGAEAEDAYGFPAGLWRWLQRHPPPALHRLTRFRSPLRGPWLTSVFGLVLLVALPFVIITGLLSYIAYAPQLGQAIPGDVGWLRLPAFTWPTRPSWLYRLTQGLHVGLGLVIIPVVLAKLWSVIPRLFVWPPARSIAQVLERLSVLMLVGGILFQIVTGVLNIQYDTSSGSASTPATILGLGSSLRVSCCISWSRSPTWSPGCDRYRCEKCWVPTWLTPGRSRAIRTGWCRSIRARPR
ncbi:transmembrane protein [Mycobacterium tuberculosis]|nr:transmembrane protein [Mycobacterium tuberculosis]